MNEFSTRITGFGRRVIDLYVDGFRSMTIGKRLWAIIIIKLAVIFLVLKLFLFPDLLQRDYDTDEERANAVRSRLMEHHDAQP
ncbi:MAG: DUF4492 domain-containing protein [Muribaculaceae bacterium]|nr:DUF4492 domain-containing protein [Muribaculaceae bacterium]